MNDYHPIGLSTDYQRQIIPHIFEAVTNRELNISTVIAQYNDMVMQLAALHDDNLAPIGSNLLLSEIGEALGCTPDATILTSIAALREADIRTMEHCDDCGSLLVVDANMDDEEIDREMYCPVCRCETLREAVEQARYCITRRLRYHQNYPPLGSARWTDRDKGIPGEDARDCDCDYCIEDRAWIAAHDAP